MMERNNLLITLLIGILCSIGFSYSHAAELNSPVGYWKTIDDITGKPKSIVQISKRSDNTLMGTVVRIFPKVGDDQTKLCTACKGQLHNQPIVGMTILSGLKPKNNQWTNGHIIDPANGKVYKCALHTLDAGKHLSIRGYIGLPLLGRSQTWERVDLMSS